MQVGTQLHRDAPSLDRRQSQLIEFGLRFLIFALLGLTLVALAVNSYLIGAGGAVVLAFDARHLLTLKNYFLAYIMGLFVIGGRIIYQGVDDLPKDLLLYVLTFLLAYAIFSQTTHRQSRPQRAPTPTNVASVEALLLVLAIAQIAAFIPQLLSYGVRGFYSGQALADLIGTYGKESFSGGAVVIVRELLATVTTATVVLYANSCIGTGTRIRYRFLAAVLLLAPLLALQRSVLLFGAFTLFAIRACERRFGHVRPSSRRRRPAGLLVVGIATMLALVIAAGIGGLRATHRSGNENSSPFSGSVLGDVLQGEFGPIVAYHEIKTNIDVLGYRYGSNIVLPLLTRVVPRAWLPAKPVTSSGYYMSKIRPGEFDAGYVLAPSIFAVAYLNFGMVGSLAVCVLVAALAARLDRAYREKYVGRLPWFLIVFASFYALMREDLSNSLFRLLVAMGAYLILRRLFARSPSEQVVMPV